ncbi:MAG: HEAT repeat domain-containing protein [Planctomycetes bacterium]|nr:HEAT repeat domain-containing protein [Planctomycetota bacterium]
MRFAAGILLFGLVAGSARADSVTLRDRTVIEGKVTSNTDTEVVINTYNSAMTAMTWGVKKFDKGQVAKVEITPEPPLVRYWRESNTARPDHAALLKLCTDNGFAVEAREEALLVLVNDPQNAEARKIVGADADRLIKGSPLHNSDLRAQAKDYAGLDPAARKAKYEEWKTAFGVTLPQSYFDRVARSLQQPKGKQEDVRLTYNARKVTGRYTIWVPDDYDPHRAYPLIVGLHGAVNGLGGIGNGKDFVGHFLLEAPKWGCIVVCPTCEPLPWTGHPDDYFTSFIAEAELLFNVDMNRVYLIGHSRGGMGTWSYGPAYADRFAAFAPAAGSGGGNAMKAHQTGTGMYIYHSSDDPQVGCSDDRGAAGVLQKQKADFVYTEYVNAKHGWPQEVIDDTLAFFKRHHQMKRGSKGPEPVHGSRPSFAEPLWPDEALYFPVRAADAGGNEVAKLVGDIETGGSLGERAANRLIELKDKAALPSLSKILQTPNQSEDAKVQSARVLGVFKDPASSGALAKALSDKSLKVRKAAADSLATAGEKKDAIAIASALEALGKEFDKELKKLEISDWENFQAANAAYVAAMSALGESHVWTVVSTVAIKKVLLATDLPKFSTGYDPELTRKKAALLIVDALPGFKEAKLKADLGAIKTKFSADAEVQSRASTAESKF